MKVTRFKIRAALRSLNKVTELVTQPWVRARATQIKDDISRAVKGLEQLLERPDIDEGGPEPEEVVEADFAAAEQKAIEAVQVPVPTPVLVPVPLPPVPQPTAAMPAPLPSRPLDPTPDPDPSLGGDS